MTTSETTTRILIYHLGSLGDTLIATPSFWAIHDAYPNAYRALLTKRVDSHKHVVVAHQLFEGTSLFHDTLLYPGERYLDKRPRRFLDFLKLFVKIWRGRFDTVIYLAPSSRNREQVERDQRFFRWCGIPTRIGFDPEAFSPVQLPPPPLPTLRSEAARLLERLSLSGFPAPRLDSARMDLGLNETDLDLVQSWLSRQEAGDGGRIWVAFAAGSNMPAKKWPEERFAEVGKRLIEQRDIWPVFFGGGEDREIGERLLAAWGRGYSAAGMLPPRAAAGALRRCRLFVGNDTGTMHLAASEGVPCVAIFSARDFPGKWYPIGPNHQVFRSTMDCEGCMLEVCAEKQNACVNSIGIDEVVTAALTRLQ